MKKVLVDTLVLDRGLGENPRFVAIVSEGSELVGDNGATTQLGHELAKKALDTEAVKAGATVISESGCIDGGGDVEEYSDDMVLAFNAGDVIFGNDPVAEFLEKEGLAVDLEELHVKVPLQTDFRIGAAYKQPVIQIVNLLIAQLVDLIVTRFKWAKDNEVLVRAIIKMFAGANGVEKYADKIFTGVQAKL